MFFLFPSFNFHKGNLKKLGVLHSQITTRHPIIKSIKSSSVRPTRPTDHPKARDPLPCLGPWIQHRVLSVRSGVTFLASSPRRHTARHSPSPKEAKRTRPRPLASPRPPPADRTESGSALASARRRCLPRSSGFPTPPPAGAGEGGAPPSPAPACCPPWWSSCSSSWSRLPSSSSCAMEVADTSTSPQVRFASLP